MTTRPAVRPRRLRRTESLRAMLRETELSPADFIFPLFVHTRSRPEEIASMPGVMRWPVDAAAEEARAAAAEGIPAVILFGLPKEKDETGSESFFEEGAVQQAVRAIRRAVPQMTIITDVCLCEYTSHGHCGVIREGAVDNDSTLALLEKVALSHAAAGADVVAPSGMMDGMVRAIRSALDEQHFTDTAILAYSAKYASAFYGPFREAADSAPQFGDRRAYQMDAPNAREAMREIALDVDEGADMVMVKPALAYLDIMQRARQRFDVPLAAYNVSGEYAMVKAAGRNGWVDPRRITLEILSSIKRAGADLIITYHAREAAQWLNQQRDLVL